MYISERMKQLNINQMENEVNVTAISCTWLAIAQSRYALKAKWPDIPSGSDMINLRKYV